MGVKKKEIKENQTQSQIKTVISKWTTTVGESGNWIEKET